MGVLPTRSGRVEFDGQDITKMKKETGVAVLLVEQYLDLTLRLADSFVIMDAGEVVRAGDKADLQDPALRQLLIV
ncbi:MAG: urtE [Frankiales bacterium]|nr:urtE [Frankiales bacterium]